MRKGSVAVLVIAVVAMLVLAAVYAHHRGWLSLPGEDGVELSYQATEVDGTEVVIAVDGTGTVPLPSVRLVLYGPGLGQGQWQPAGSGVEDLLPGVDLGYRDDGDGALGGGDEVTVRSEEGLAHGNWYLHVVFPRGGAEVNHSVRFQVLPEGVGPFADDLEVTFLDVGQGDAELVRTSDGRWVLIDAGPTDAADRLLEQLAARGVDRLAALVISHPHLDHYAGADEVLAAYEVSSVYHPGLGSEASSFAVFLEAVAAEGCPVYTDQHLDPGDYLNISLAEDFRVMSLASSGEANEASLVLLVANRGMSVLFTGDLGEEGEEAFMERWGEVDVDVLKVGHHGSRYSSSMAFLRAVAPERAVIEVGDNSYGHPHAETLERFAQLGIPVERTDGGAVTIAQAG